MKPRQLMTPTCLISWCLQISDKVGGENPQLAIQAAVPPAIYNLKAQDKALISTCTLRIHSDVLVTNPAEVSRRVLHQNVNVGKS